MRQESNLQKEIFFEAGEEFNLNSPRQVAHILFEKLDHISAEWNCFKSMLSELNQLENGDKK